jgi:hypothetical protein
MFNLLKICLNIYSYFNPYLRKKIIWPPPIKMSGSVPDYSTHAVKMTNGSDALKLFNGLDVTIKKQLESSSFFN